MVFDVQTLAGIGREEKDSEKYREAWLKNPLGKSGGMVYRWRQT
jgi:hypothetical protein